MYIKSRTGLVGVLALIALFTAVPAVLADSKVPPVTNLHLSGGGIGSVQLQWDAPSLPSSSTTTIDVYIIKRDGRQIDTIGVVGDNGVVDTTYIDDAPSSQQATYTVIAVDSSGNHSPPTSVSVPAPQGVQSAQPEPIQTVQDGIQSSDLCKSIIPPDVRGANQPTPLEKYGCGAGMNTVNDSGPSHINLLFTSPTVPRPIHDFIQNFLIQIPITLGQEFFLIISALSIWVMDPNTYMGIANLFGQILQAFNGNPNYPSLITFALALGIVTLAWRFFTEQNRKGYKSAGVIIAALTALTLFLSGPVHYMSFAVNKPMQIYSWIEGTITDLTAGTGVSNSQSYGLTVVPTYNGNSIYNSIRKDENTDWLIFQYLPQCAVNFDDYRYVMFNDVTGEHVSWCERFVQLWGNGTKDERDTFKAKLKKANPSVYSYFTSGDQLGRVAEVVTTKATLTIHNLMKALVRLSVFAGEFLLLTEMLFALVWLIASMIGTDNVQFAAARRMRTMFHWIKVPAILLAIGIVEQTAEATVIARLFDHGILLLAGLSFAVELVTLIGLFVVILKLHKEHKAAMERLGAAGSAAGSGARRALGVAAGAVTAGAGAAGFEWLRERAERRRAREGQDNGDGSFYDTHYVPPFDGFGHDGYDRPLLAAGPTAGQGERRQGNDPPPTPDGQNGYRPYIDAESFDDDGILDAEVVDETHLLEAGNDFHGAE